MQEEKRRGYEKRNTQEDLERQTLQLDLIACTSAFKWVIHYT